MDKGCWILIMLLFAALIIMPVQSADKSQVSPGALALQSTNKIYFADSTQTPGNVFALNGEGIESIYFSRPTGSLESFVFNPANRDELFYINTYAGRIFKSVKTPTGWSLEGDFFNQNTQIKDLAFSTLGGLPRLFFSEAGGAVDGNAPLGKIYWIDSSGNAVLYYVVNQTNNMKYWNGDFTFDDGGILYISSGNEVPASVYRIKGITTQFNLKVPPNTFPPMRTVLESNIKSLYTDYSGGISGIVYKGGYIYYVSGQEIYILDLSTMKKSLYRSLPGHSGLSDVGF
jgi:hypothetical protein